MEDAFGVVPWCNVLVCGRGLDAGSQQAKEVADFGWKEGMITCIRVGAGRRARTCCIKVQGDGNSSVCSAQKERKDLPGQSCH